MNRILNFYPLILAMISIILILSICLINMLLHAKYKKSTFIILIHALSLFGVSGLIFHMLSVAMFVHPLFELYQKLSSYSLLLVFVSTFFGLIALFADRTMPGIRALQNNIPEVLKSIEAIVFVIDRNGIISHINHPEKYRDLFGSVETIDHLVFLIKEHCYKTQKDHDKWDEIEIGQFSELYFETMNIYAMIQLSPIYFGNNYMGHTVVVEDITALRDSEKELETQNESLRHANSKLSQYIKAAGALEAEKERLQILTHVQKTLIQDIEKALEFVRHIKHYLVETETYSSALTELATQLRGIYQKVRNSIGEIAGKEIKS